MTKEAVITYVNIPGVENINQRLFENNQFAMRMKSFNIFKRIILRAKRVNEGTYEFSVKGIKYNAVLMSSLKRCEQEYYRCSNVVSIIELLNTHL